MPFFKKRGSKAFEWYGEFTELSSYLLKYVKPKDKILIVGCGNSTLGMNLYDAGCKNIINIDVSPVVIKQMKERNKNKRPDLDFVVMDVTKMNFEDNKYSVVLDKGTLDALMSDSSAETECLINKYFSEVKRVLSNCGRFICISLLQEHILEKVINSFAKNEFAFRVIRCHDVELKAKEEGESTMPVFMVVATKFMKLLNPILEISLVEDSLMRLKSMNEMKETIISIQESASLCNNLYKSNVATDGEVSLDLYVPGEEKPRYTIFVVDQLNTKREKSYAAFIVPQGSEVNWLFCTKEGRQQLLKSAQYSRLAIVILNREQHYKNLDEVKLELADSIKNLAPCELVKSQIPFLSVGSEIGNRNICFQGQSEISGPFVVEEVETENGLFRRLIFLNNQFVVQSEVKLKKVKKEDNSEVFEIDPWFIACDHHIFMTLGVNTALKNKDNAKIVIIGLGGGGLCTFMGQFNPKLYITAVELDEAILNLATKHFGLNQNDKLQVKIEDGLDFIKSAVNNNKKFDAILFDVDSKDSSVGMSCPPKPFVAFDFLQSVEKCLTSDGYFILNIVARNMSLRNKVVDDLKKVYRFVSSYKVFEDINEIVFCSKCKIPFQDWKNSMKKSANYFNKIVKQKSSTAKDVLEISAVLDNFKLEN